MTRQETAVCDANCTSAICGDAYANSAAGEECDDGNSELNDRCFNDCTLNVCGDGILSSLDEECDDGQETLFATRIVLRRYVVMHMLTLLPKDQPFCCVST